MIKSQNLLVAFLSLLFFFLLCTDKNLYSAESSPVVTSTRQLVRHVDSAGDLRRGRLLVHLNAIAHHWATDGSWVESEPLFAPQDAFAGPDTRSITGCGSVAERAVPLRQRWRPHPHSAVPDYFAWNRSETCRALHGRWVILVGDSMSRQHHESLFSALKAPLPPSLPRGTCRTGRICDAKGEMPAAVFWVPGTLIPPETTFSVDRHGECAGDDLLQLPADRAATNWSTLFEHVLKRALAESPRPPIVVINRGAHHTWDMDVHMAGINRAISMANSAGALTFYRTTHTGHAGQAAALRQSPPLGNDEVQTSWQEPFSFDWAHFEDINFFTTSRLEESTTVVLDIFAATKLRADSHPAYDGGIDSLHCT